MSAALRPLARARANASAIASIPVGVSITAMRSPLERRQRLGEVLVAAAREADEIKLGVGVGQGPGDRVGALQGGDDALQPGGPAEGLERLIVGDRRVGGAALVAQPGMLGPRAGIVQPSRDRVGLE